MTNTCDPALPHRCRRISSLRPTWTTQPELHSKILSQKGGRGEENSQTLRKLDKLSLCFYWQKITIYLYRVQCNVCVHTLYISQFKIFELPTISNIFNSLWREHSKFSLLITLNFVIQCLSHPPFCIVEH